MLASSTEQTTAIRFKRLFIIVNPRSTHAAAAAKRIDEVKHILHSVPTSIVDISEHSNESSEHTLEKHASILGPETLLCIAAGDGTTNSIIQTLITSKKLSDQARKTVILPLWGGNANDLAHMLNGAAYRAKLKDIILKGNIVPVHPLECDMSSKSGKRIIRIAACYASFGATAFAARQLNNTAHRESRLHTIPGGRMLLELITVVGALMEAPMFSVKESNDVKVVYERTFSNGSRMAKITHLPVKLTDEAFYLNTLETKKWSSIPRILEATSKRLSAKFLRNFAYFTTQEVSWAQFDGEPEKIPAHTKVQVQLSHRPFYALSTILETKRKK